MSPKVSILIPVYNRAGLIVRCLTSALAQTHTNIEVVVSDNASTDDTWSVVNRLAASDSRVRPFRNDSNLGPVRNWIAGLAQCTGEYVKVLWSDDWIEPTFVAELLASMDADPQIGLAFSATLVHFADRDEPFHYFPDQRLFPRTAYLTEALVRGKTPVSPGCTLVRRDLALFQFPIGDNRDLNSIAERYGAGPDLLFILEAVARSTHVAHVPKFLAHFGAEQSSITVRHPREVQLGYKLTRDYFAHSPSLPAGMAHIKARFQVRRLHRRLKQALHL
jgi:glycosyltransferase involved in cell wall biosynthesis